MKNRDIVDAYEKLSNLRTAGTTRFPVRVSYAIIHNIRVLEPIVEDIMASRRELIIKYGEPRENDEFFISDMPTFNREKDALDNTNTEVFLVKVKLSEIESMELTVAEMDGLYCMIEGEEE